MFCTSPKQFNKTGDVDKHAIDSLKWAYDNAYHGHFKNHSGSKFRTMLNAFIGKLGEFGIYKFFNELGYSVDPPELVLRQKGEWDDGDLIVDSSKVQVKTTTFSSNFMLIKKGDWDKEGNYKWGKNGADPNYGAFFLARIMPDPKFIFQDEASMEELINICNRVSWSYEVTGFVTKKDIIMAINENYIIPRGKMLNGKVKMKEDLIYFQAGDLLSPYLIPHKLMLNGK